VPDGPRRAELPGDHHGDAGEPAWTVQQLGDQPQAQEVGLRRLLGGLLLEDKADPEQHRCCQRDHDVRYVHIARLSSILAAAPPACIPAVALPACRRLCVR
jgi:hypothetical protein